MKAFKDKSIPSILRVYLKRVLQKIKTFLIKSSIVSSKKAIYEEIKDE